MDWRFVHAVGSANENGRRTGKSNTEREAEERREVRSHNRRSSWQVALLSQTLAGRE